MGFKDNNQAPLSSTSHLPDTDWQPSYSHEDGDLVKLFYTPALTRSCLYQRITGYFSADVLALAAKGLDALIARGGAMQLIVGCTLGEKEIHQIKEGYQLRELLAGALAERLGLQTESPTMRERLGWLAWMVANSYLDIKLAVPTDANGQFHPGLGLYHAKSGILTDAAGNRLVFTGSLNETAAGWLHNWESFSVSCSWRGEWDLKRVEKAALEFALLWSDATQSARVVDFPEALRQQLLQYMPPNDRVVKPVAPAPTPPIEPHHETTPSPDETLSADERRRRVWTFIKKAPRRDDGVLIAIKTSTVEPWPHQLRVYRRMLDAWPFRLLIADEVGLGKTIEAGMIIRHVWISQKARRICIMAPGSITRQWQAELYEKFNLLVPIYTGKALLWPAHHFQKTPCEQPIDRDQWTKTPFVIVSSHLARRADRQSEMIEADAWELLVLDEAHHARRRGAGSKQEKGPNRLLRLMQKVQAKTQALLLLTATPMQVDPVEIWDLLHLLGLPPQWDATVFVNYFERLGQNPDAAELHQLARLFQTVEQVYGPTPDNEINKAVEKFGLRKLQIKNVLKALREPKSLIPVRRLTAAQRRAALAILRAASPILHRMSRHTRHLLRAYHQKGLLSTPIAKRLVKDVTITLTEAERDLYQDVENYIGNTYQQADPGNKNAVGFVMTIYRRRLASSFHALRQTLDKRLSKLDQPDSAPHPAAHPEEDLPQDERVDEILAADEVELLENRALVVEEQDRIRELLKAIARLGTDSKALRLIEELQAAFKADYDAAIIFTQYTATMDFLRTFLSDRLALKNGAIGCFSGEGGLRQEQSGAWSHYTKEQIKRMLRRGQIRILICTDAAGEGLNLQYCGVLVNYDLPWTPMKVEQRIGRIDRIGQKFKEIQIINMAYADTVEADVYFALSKRIGLFNGVVGKLQPILAQIPKEFESATLIPVEQRERARYEAVSRVNQLADETEAAGFDIDEVSASDLEIPQLPDPPFLPSDLERILQNEDLLPPGVEVKKLDAHSYALLIPGYSELARVTTNPAVFDEHFENHQLFCPDGPLFNQLAETIPESDPSFDWRSATHLNDLMLLSLSSRER